MVAAALTSAVVLIVVVGRVSATRVSGAAACACTAPRVSAQVRIMGTAFMVKILI